MRVVSERSSRSRSARCPSTPRVVAGGNYATPWRALAVLDGTVARYRLFALNAQPGMPDRDGVTLESPFVGPGMRGQRPAALLPLPPVAGAVRCWPAPLPPDVVLVQTSVPVGRHRVARHRGEPPARGDRGRPGPRRAGGRAAQPAGPVHLRGRGAALQTSSTTRSRRRRRCRRRAASPSDGDPQPSIGDRVAALVGDGATLQLGIGAVPDAVLAGLHRRRGLAVWSEMFSDGVLGTGQGGRAGPGAARSPRRSRSAAPDLYAWLDRNPDVRMLRTETVNDPALDRRLQADGLGQQRAPGRPARAGERRRWVQRHGSTPGSAARPTSWSARCTPPGGQAIIALPSWHPKADVSTVVPRLDGPVTSFQHSYIVSEQGTAVIWGHDVTRPGGADHRATSRTPRCGRNSGEASRELGLACSKTGPSDWASPAAVGTRHSSLVPGVAAPGSAGSSRSSPPNLAARSARLRSPLRRPSGRDAGSVVGHQDGEDPVAVDVHGHVRPGGAGVPGHVGQRLAQHDQRLFGQLRAG